MCTNAHQRPHPANGFSRFTGQYPPGHGVGPVRWLLDSTRIPQQAINLTEPLNASMKEHPDPVSIIVGAFQPSAQDTERSLATRYEALVSASQVIGTHHDIEGLFSALATELVRVIEDYGFFDDRPLLDQIGRVS